MNAKQKLPGSISLRYGISISVVLVAVLLRWLLDPLLADAFPLVTLFGAVGIAVWFGGYRSALIAAILGYVLCAYFFIPPRGSLGLDQTQNLIGLIAYLFTCGIIIGLGESSRASAFKAEFQGEILRVTMASMGDAVITTDRTANIKSLNSIAESLTGWTDAEAKGQPLETVFHIVNETTRKVVESPATRALAEGIIVGLANHTVLIRKDGTELPIEDSAAPIRDANDEMIGCVLIFRDASHQRQAEQVTLGKLSAAQFLASIIESSEDAILSKSLDGTIRTWNQSAERLFDYKADEMIGQHISRLIPKDRIQEEELIIARLKKGERVEHFETLRARRNGDLMNVSLTISPVRDESGQVIGASKIIRDITEVKRIEAALQARERDLTDFFENAMIGLHWVGPDGIVLRANQADMDLLGVTSEEYIGHHISEFHVDQPVIEDILRRLANREYLRNYSARLRCKDGSIKHVLIDSSVLWDGDRFVHSRCFTRDVTDQHRAEAALRDADRRKDEFLAILAHELRNPLAPIMNWLEILKRSKNDAKITEQARSTIERQIDQMVRLIDDLLDVSRITRNNLELRKERLDLQSVVLNAVEMCKPMADKASHVLSVNLPDEPVYVLGDRVRLAQVFGNLLTNSCKYTDDRGRISLTLEVKDDIASVSIEDTGIGIPVEFTDKVFDMFVQVDRTLERTRGGLGIGLTLVKELVELHGGRVTAYSEGLGTGSRFTVQLPVDNEVVVAQEEPPAPPEITNNPRRILVVDDNRDSALTLAMLLKMSGNETTTAYDGEEALRQTELFRPSAVFLDIGLPKMNGYQVCEKIREQEWGKNLFIVAMTGWGQDEDRRKSQVSGFNAHLVKPVDFGELSLMLDQLKT